jgi:hypothetical protein
MDAIPGCCTWHLTWPGSNIWPARKCTVDYPELGLGYHEDQGMADATGRPHAPAPIEPTTLGANLQARSRGGLSLTFVDNLPTDSGLADTLDIERLNKVHRAKRRQRIDTKILKLPFKSS